MPNKILSWLVVLSAVTILSGCVQTRAYVTDKERVDQDIPGVPATGPAKTRQVVVVEVARKDQDLPEAKASKEPGAAETKDQSKVVTESKETVVVHQDNFTFPKMTSETLTKEPATAAAVEGNALPAQYTVQKDDTLQKISKKFYASYSKWTRIYDANKDKIKDPNFLKPGLVLTVPALEAAPEVKQEGQ